MIGLIELNRLKLQTKLAENTLYKSDCLKKLKFYNEKYIEDVSNSIVKIQRWFRSYMKREKLRNFIIKEKFRVKRQLRLQMEDMKKTIDA